MKRLFAFILTAVLLAAPVLPAAAAAAPDSRSADPSACSHHFEVSVVVEATCVDKGLLAYTCSKCGLTYTAETLPDGAHDYALAETTATCTEDGENIYTCTRCGDSYTEPAEAQGHVPEEDPASCVRGRFCVNCGELLEPPTGHDFVYQYDAVFAEDGTLTDYGTWQCANCGETMAATEGNAIYYYDLGEGGDPTDASDTDTVAVEASDTVTYVDDDSATDAVPETADVPPTPLDEAETAGADPRTGLWIAISAVALLIIVAEAVALVRSLKKNKTTL